MSKTKSVKKKVHGGARKGAGRKPATDPKVPVTIYVEESVIDAMVSIDKLRNACYSFLQENTGNTPLILIAANKDVDAVKRVEIIKLLLAAKYDFPLKQSGQYTQQDYTLYR